MGAPREAPILRSQPMSCTSGSHTVYHHRYHIVWITKYRYKVLEGALRERIRVIIRQVCDELGVQIVSGVLSKEHVHMFVEIPPHIAVSDFVRRVKGRSSHRVQMEFPDIRRRDWGRHFWASYSVQSFLTKFSEHEADRGETQECQGIAGEVFKILGQSPASVEPGEGAFDNP